MTPVCSSVRASLERISFEWNISYMSNQRSGCRNGYSHQIETEDMIMCCVVGGLSCGLRRR